MALVALYHRFSQDTARAFQAYQVMRFLSVLAAGIVLVKLRFDDAEVGQFEWFVFGVHALSFFWAMGLKNALLSYYPDLDANAQRKLFGGLFLTLILVAFLLSLVAIVGDFFGGEYSLYFAVFFALSVPAGLSEQWLILKSRSAELFRLGIWLHLLYVAILLIAASGFGTLEAVFFGLVLWALIRFFYTVVLLGRAVDWGFHFSVLKPFLSFALPLILYILLGSGMDVIDGFLVEHFFDDGEFAKFRYGAKELPITALLIGALATATIPQAVANMDVAISGMRSRLDSLMNWMFPLSILLMIISPFLYQFFYSESYLVSAQIFNIYLLILVSRVLTPQVLLYAMKENKVLMWVSLTELLINLGLSLFLMQSFGILGIAYATIVAYTIEKLILWAYLKRYKNIPLGTYINVPKYLIWSILLITTYIMTTIF